MDAIDVKILSILGRHGRATMTDIAAELNLSLSACHRRFRDLEASGVIEGFTVRADLDRLGMPFEALVFVNMVAGDSTVVTEFEKSVREIPNVIQAYRLFGQPDYQVHIAAESKKAFQQLYDEVLSQLPGIRRLTSTLIMSTVVPHQMPQPL